jgi:L-lactate dehydrogenase complex protein LldG
MNGRNKILTTIRASLAKNRAMLETEAARAPHAPPPFVHPPQDDLVAQFAAELAALDGVPHRCADDEEALDVIRDILRTHQATSAIMWDIRQIGLPGLDALLAQEGMTSLDGAMVDVRNDRATRLQRLEASPICISGAEVGIAESGTLVLRSGVGRPRLASLLAPVYIAILRRSQIVRGLGEALATLQVRHGPDIFADSSALMFITGPSRTGDIEQTLVKGVHGPGEVHVVLVG